MRVGWAMIPVLALAACEAPRDRVRILDRSRFGATTIIVQEGPPLTAVVLDTQAELPWVELDADRVWWTYNAPPGALGLDPGPLDVVPPDADTWPVPLPDRAYTASADGWASRELPAETFSVRLRRCPRFEVEQRRFPAGQYPRQGTLISANLTPYGDEVYFSFAEARLDGGSLIALDGSTRRFGAFCTTGGFTARSGEFVCGRDLQVYAKPVTSAGPDTGPWRSLYPGTSFVGRVAGRDDDQSLVVAELPNGTWLGTVDGPLARGPDLQFDPGFLVSLGPGRAAGAEYRDVVVFTSTVARRMTLTGGTITALVDAPGVGLVAGTAAGELFRQSGGDAWRRIESLYLGKQGVRALVRHPHGFVALLTSGAILHGDEDGRLCPPVKVSDEAIFGLASRFGPCAVPGCRWAPTVLALAPDRLVIVRPGPDPGARPALR